MVVNRSVLRGLAVLEAMAETGEPVALGTLVKRVQLDKATVWRLLATLQEAGYVAQDEDTGRYALTNRVLRISRSFFEHSDLRSIARPHLARLRDAAGETVHLGQLDGARVVYVDKLEGERSIRLVSSVAQSMSVHTTALGKAMLAAMPREQARALVQQLDLAPNTERSITNPAMLYRELEAVASVGYATDREENEENVFCVGAPVLDGRARVIAAISLSGPKFRVGQRVKELGELCRKTAKRISSDVEGANAMIAMPPLPQADESAPSSPDETARSRSEIAESTP